MTRKPKRLIMSVFFLVYVGGILILGFEFQDFIKIKYTTSVNYSLEVFSVFIPVICGILIAFPNLIMKLKTDGIININIIKLVVFGIPTLYITILPFLYSFDYLPLRFLLFLKYFQDLALLCGIVLGYVLVDSIDKSN
jgi:hypothetical protein